MITENSIINMETITAYRTSDGQIFEKEVEAKNHELLLESETWYNENKLYSPYGPGSIDFTILHEWMVENRNAIRKYFIF